MPVLERAVFKKARLNPGEPMKSTVAKMCILLGLMLCASSLYAGSGISGANIFDSILNRFQSTSATWETKITAYASWLFWSLVLLSMIWTYSLLALKRAEIQEFLAETMRFLIVTGFFNWLLIHGPAIANAFIASLRQIAADASGLKQSVSPSGIMDVGFDIASKVVDNSSIWSPATTTVGLIVAAVILVVLALVAVNMLLILISAWIITYGGIFLLGFGGGRWTQDIAINYYKTVLGIAVQAFAMVLIVGIGHSFVDQYYTAMSTEISIKELLVMLVVSIILLSIINKIPPMLSGIVSGGGFNGGPGVGLSTAMGAASMAGAAVAGGVSMATSAVANIAGAGSALSEAFKAASQSRAASASGSGLAASMGKAGHFVSSMGAHLAAGTADVMRQKMDSVKTAMTSRIAQTPGGQVAQSINEKSQSVAGDQPDGLPSASEGSLTAGQQNPSPETHDEVSQFVNKS
ncbi:putative conjugal transfer protein TrbL [Legionella birminghamensis]|uniref:Conjugal transfer protein TrbL n=2 Tax=Legionellaceae TaxID=444 RepID=A0A378JQN4_9GAMM|nr:P-type conjugative transfer protein TrbL [Legionella birminghamensis]KTC71801.1 putative conjugal transfer protein TrbL [Legionella birminghamensis]STX60843.1 putative conjugal transfer protein TrbL [Legionella birminghamensis]